MLLKLMQKIVAGAVLLKMTYCMHLVAYMLTESRVSWKDVIKIKGKHIQ